MFFSSSGKSGGNSFSSKKRRREDAFKDLKRELDARARVESTNSKRQDREESLLARCEGRGDGGGKLVYFDLDFYHRDERPAQGRFIFELFSDLLPRTCDTFVRLMQQKGEDQTFVGGSISNIKPGKFCDVMCPMLAEGQRDTLVFGSADREARHELKHSCPGVLSIPSSRSNSFRICFRDHVELDGKSVVFGRMVTGYETLSYVERQCYDGEIGGAKRTTRVAACAEIDGSDVEKMAVKYAKPLYVPTIQKVTRRNKYSYEGAEQHTPILG